MNSLQETKNIVEQLGVAKVKKNFETKIVLGFIAGAMIALGYLAYLKALSLGSSLLVAASLFPIGLIVILFAGGELITGNMMVVGTAYLNKKVTLIEMLENWLHITIANILGALFIILICEKLNLFTDVETVLISAANGKASYDWGQLILSGMMCNWFVGLAVWLGNAYKDGAGKTIGVWFPVMIFVFLGFQHSVANTFLLGSAYFLNAMKLSTVIYNFIFSYIGNVLGALILVSGFYTIASTGLKQ